MKSAGTDSLEINGSLALLDDGTEVSNPTVVKTVISPVKRNPASPARDSKRSRRKKIPGMDNTCMARNIQWTRDPACEVRKTAAVRMIETRKITTATISCIGVAMSWRLNSNRVGEKNRPCATSDTIALTMRTFFLVMICDILSMRIAQKMEISNILILYEKPVNSNLQL